MRAVDFGLVARIVFASCSDLFGWCSHPARIVFGFRSDAARVVLASRSEAFAWVRPLSRNCLPRILWFSLGCGPQISPIDADFLQGGGAFRLFRPLGGIFRLCSGGVPAVFRLKVLIFRHFRLTRGGLAFAFSLGVVNRVSNGKRE
jgi:hypothetical protein